jgi:hypothetical protein
MSRRQTAIAAGDIPTNSVGGVLVTPSEIEAAFRFLDPSGKGKITMSSLRQKLSAFFPDMPISEVKFLLGDKKEMTASGLFHIPQNPQSNTRKLLGSDTFPGCRSSCSS